MPGSKDAGFRLPWATMVEKEPSNELCSLLAFCMRYVGLPESPVRCKSRGVSLFLGKRYFCAYGAVKHGTRGRIRI